MIRYPRYLPHMIVALFLMVAGYLACQPRLEARQLPTLLLQKQHLVYEGAFRLPGAEFDGGGRPMAFNPANGTLFIGGTAEVSIPAIRTGASLSDLATATVFARRTRVDLDAFVCNEAHIHGGILPWAGDLIASGYCYFDGGTEQRTHFRVRGTTVTGPFQVGTIGAGFVGGPMVPIPTEWRAAFGGPALTSQCCIPVISRTSSGPAASVFNPADVGVKNPVPATQVLGYPITHETLGPLFTTTQWMGGMVFPNGTRSVLFFSGRRSKGAFCYGPGTDDQSLHLKVYPGAPQSETWCYDPVNHDKGTHGYPYAHFVYAYDANDLVAVKNGSKLPWQVLPYATWEFDVPFQYGQRVIPSVAYDPATKRVFMTAANGDGDKPLVHVFTINAAASVPPVVVVPPPVVTPPPPPPVQDTTPPLVSFSIAPGIPVVGQPVTFTAVASDNVGVARVTYRAYGIEFDSDATPTPTATWTTTATWTPTVAGLAFLRVFAFDAAGNQGESGPGAFDVNVLPAGTPPQDADGDGVPDSADTCPAVAGPDPTGCPPVLPPPQVLTPLPIIATANVARAVTQCRITVPQFVGSPDGQLGWRLQIQRNGGSHGSAESSSPYGPSGGFTALVGVGSYVMTAKWTKPGQLTVIWQLGTQKCP